MGTHRRTAGGVGQQVDRLTGRAEETIAAGSVYSGGSIDKRGFALMAVQLPANWKAAMGATLRFQSFSANNGPRGVARGTDGVAIELNVSDAGANDVLTINADISAHHWLTPYFVDANDNNITQALDVVLVFLLSM